MGMSLIVITPLPLAPFNLLPTEHNLVITALGRKNPLALGSEVWVESFTIGNATVPVSHLSLDSNWVIKDGIPSSFKYQPAVISWRGQADFPPKLTFISHNWSGRVKVTWDNKVQIIDLYSPNMNFKTIFLPMQSSPVNETVLYILSYICTGAVISFIFLTIIAWILSLKQPVQLPITTPRYHYIRYAIPFIVVSSIYLLAFWPGLMTLDSLDQWNQASIGKFSDWHPLFHTLNIWVLIHLWKSPAIVALAQILAMSLVLAWGVEEFRRIGVPSWACWLTIALFCIIPVFPQMTVTLWKDIAYSISTLALSILALKVVISRGRWLHCKYSWVILGIVSALVALYRHNGSPVAFGFLLFGILYYRKYWKQWISGLSSGLIIFALVAGPLSNLLGVDSHKESILPAISFFGIASHVNNDARILNSSENKYLVDILPADGWKSYNCTSEIGMISTAGYSVKNYQKSAGKLVDSFIRLSIDNPFVTLQHFVCKSAYIWQITDMPLQVYLGTRIYDKDTEKWQRASIINNGFDLNLFTTVYHNTPIPAIRDFLNSVSSYQYFKETDIPWRPAIYLYLMIFAITVYSLYTRSFSMTLIAIPSIIQSCVMVAASLTNEMRYQYPVMIVGMFVFLPLLTYGSIKLDEKYVPVEQNEQVFQLDKSK